MKRSLKVIGLIAIVGLLASCRKDKDQEFTEADAVDVVSASLSDTGESIMDFAKTTDEETVNFESAQCGAIISFTRGWEGNNGNRSFTYDATGTRENICVDNVFTQANINSSFSTTFNGPRYESTGNGTRGGMLSGFNTSDSFYTWNGSSEKTANGLLINQDVNVSTSKSTESTIFIDKESHEITGGNSTFSVTGSGDNGNAFTHNGTVEFLGDRSAIITINGNSTTVSW
ncbi:MAG: hypothetical protein AAF193_05405 [Bacteroidota bacterium]